MSQGSRLIESISHAILKWRVAVLVLFALCFVVLGFFATQFKIDASADTLLTKNNPIFIKTQQVNQTFSPSEFILVAYQPTNKDVFTQQAIDDISNLAKGFAEIERVETINSMLSVPLIESKEQLLSGEDVSKLNYFTQNYPPETLRKLLKNHPIYTDLLVNKQQDATAIQIVFKKQTELQSLNQKINSIQEQSLSRELTTEEQDSLSQLQQQAKSIEAKVGKQRVKELEQIEKIITGLKASANIYIGGSYVVGIRLIEIVNSDLMYFGIGISLLISILLLLLFRSLKWLLFPMLACISSVALTMGILAILKLPATVVSANFIALQLILTLAIMVHLITHYREISRNDPHLSQHQRIMATLKQKLAPCFYAAVTTSVGFGSLIFSGIQPVIDFGFMMLIANAVILCVALALFPALLSFIKPTTETNEYHWLSNGLNRLGETIKKKPKRFIVIPLTLLTLVSSGITRLNVENSFIDYFHPSTQIYKELSFIDQQFGGSTPLDIVIKIDETTAKQDLFVSAAQINKLHLAHAVVDSFDATGNVTSLINFTTLAKQLNDNKPLTEYELDVIYSLVDKKIIEELIGAYLDTDSNTMRISTRIQDTLPGLNRAEFLDRLKADLQSVDIAVEQFELTNLFVLYQDILSRLFNSQIVTLGIVYLALFGVLLLIFKSLKIALIALVPNVITTTAILGLIGWTGIPLDLMTITIAAIAMGIAIDDTIHFVDSYIQNSHDAPMKAAFSHTGLAIAYTSTLIATGFSMFAFSDFMPSVYFGILTASAMLLAFIVDLTVLPALLKIFLNKQKKLPE